MEGSSDFSSFRFFCVIFSRRLKTFAFLIFGTEISVEIILPELDGVFRCRVDFNRCVNNNLFWDVEWFTCLDNLAVRLDIFGSNLEEIRLVIHFNPGEESSKEITNFITFLEISYGV